MTAPHPIPLPLAKNNKKKVILNPHTSEIKTFPHLTTRTPKTPLLVRKKKTMDGQQIGEEKVPVIF